MNSNKIFASILLLSCGAASAQSSNCGDTIFFGNGVNNSLVQARTSLGVLRNGLRVQLPAVVYNELRFRTAFNPTSGLVEDLVESIDQLSDAAGIPPFEFEVALGIALGVTAPPAEIENQWNELLADRISTLGENSNDLVAQHLALYRAQLEQGRRIVVVAHSQGNLLANAAYEHLTPAEKNSIGVFAVGTPASNVIGSDNPYQTSLSDKVINLVRTLFPNTLPANIDVGTDGDFLGHGFNETYMRRGNSTRNAILSGVGSMLGSLQAPDVGEPNPDCGNTLSLYSVGGGLNGGFFVFPSSVEIHHVNENTSRDGSTSVIENTFINDFSRTQHSGRTVCRSADGSWFARSEESTQLDTRELGPPGQGQEITDITESFSIQTDGTATFSYTQTMETNFDNRLETPFGLNSISNNESYFTTSFEWNLENGSASYNTDQRSTSYRENDYDSDAPFEDWVTTGVTTEQGSGTWPGTVPQFEYGSLRLISRIGPGETIPAECM